MSSPFTGEHFRRLQTALLSAFDYSALRQMVKFELGEELEHLVAFHTATLEDMVHELIRHYGARTGGIHQLMQAAHDARPADEGLSALCKEFIAQDFAPQTLLGRRPLATIPLQRPPRAEHFVDRKQALADLLAALQPGVVVTLCGPGGIGKTALAAEAIWLLPIERFPDGILTYSFYGRSQIDLAFEHIARCLGEELKPDLCAAAARALAGRQLLLLLDGAEEADDLAKLLAMRGSCGILVTSRRRSDALAMRQDVDPLPLADAIALLQAWGGSRASDIDSSKQISDLVGRLPLALRLIGRYLAQTEEDAADYLTWLEATPLAALDHGQRYQESVPLLLERSLQQVSVEARTVLSVIGCLALASFDRATIAAALDMPPLAMQRPLGELVNYSLLQRTHKSYSVTHALIHIFARERIVLTVLLLRRLAVYFTNTVKEQADNFDVLNSLRPHIVALLGHCQTREVWAPVKDLALAIDPYLDRQGYWQERITVLNVALATARSQQDRQAEGAWLGNLGATYQALGKVETAIAHYEQALSISQQIADHRNVGKQFGNLGNAHGSLGFLIKAIDYHKEGLQRSNLAGDHVSIANHLGNLGNLYRDIGQLEDAVEFYRLALAVNHKLGDRYMAGKHLGNLGILYQQLGEVSQAIKYYEQAILIIREFGDRLNESSRLGDLGIAYLNLGQFEKAICCHQDGLQISQEIGDRRGVANHLGNLGNIYLTLHEMTKAIIHYEQALTIAQEISARHNIGAWLGNLGIAYHNLGQVELARSHFDQALTIAQATGDRRSEANHLTNLGIISSKLGQTEEAQRSWTAALVIYNAIHSPAVSRVQALLAGKEDNL